MSLIDKIKTYAENAPEAGYGPALNYGKIAMTPIVVAFQGKGQKPTRTPMKDGEDLKGKLLELVFEVDIKEFNESLEFTYERSVNVQKSRKDKDTGETTNPTDWSEVVLPSLEATFGQDWAEALAKNPYVEVEDVPSTRPAYESKRVFNEDGTPKMIQPKTIKFLRVFKSKDECLAARQETYGSRANGSDEVAEGNASQVPADVKAQVKTIVEQMGSSDAARDVLAAAFPQWSVDALLTAANPL